MWHQSGIHLITLSITHCASQNSSVRAATCPLAKPAAAGQPFDLSNRGIHPPITLARRCIHPTANLQEFDDVIFMLAYMLIQSDLVHLEGEGQILFLKANHYPSTEIPRALVGFKPIELGTRDSHSTSAPPCAHPDFIAVRYGLFVLLYTDRRGPCGPRPTPAGLECPHTCC